MKVDRERIENKIHFIKKNLNKLNDLKEESEKQDREED